MIDSSSDFRNNDDENYGPQLSFIIGKIEMLQLPMQIAYAICCCEQLFPKYSCYINSRGLPDLIWPILGELWDHVCGRVMQQSEIDEKVAAIRTQDLHDDAADRDLRLYWAAIDALDATHASLLACKTGLLKNIVSAAQSLTNNHERSLWNEITKDYPNGLSPSDTEQAILAINNHPAIKLMMQRQLRILTFLLECEGLDKTNAGMLKTLCK